MARWLGPPSLYRAMAGSLRQGYGLPAVALAKAGGEGSRTPVLMIIPISVYMHSPIF